MFKPKNILVTGGLGFIGSNFIRYLLGSEPSVTIINLDAKTYAANVEATSNLVSERYTLVIDNILNFNLLISLLQDYNIDAVVHFAAESHVDNSINNPQEFISTNIVGTYTLLEAVKTVWLKKRHLGKGECKFYHISTDEVFGSCETLTDPSFSETTPYNPRSPYSASKAASNHLVSSYFHTYNLPTIISNCSNNYGPFQHKEKFIPKIIDCCINNKPISIYGDGSNIRDWLFVQDHCEAICKLLFSDFIGEQFNIGANNEVSNNAVAHHVCRLMDEYLPREQAHSNLIYQTADRPGHDWRYSIDSKKINGLLGWKPRVSFIDGLRRTIEFYLMQQDEVQVQNETEYATLP